MYGVIYKVTNTVNGNFYIGQTKMRLGSRWSKHKQDAREGKGWVLASAIRKYGVESFSMEVLEHCNSKEELNLAEIRRIAEMKPAYNSCAGGGGVGSPSAEVRRKLSVARLGKKISEETRQRMSNAQKGHAVSGATAAKIQAALAPRYEAMRQARIEKYGTDKRVRASRTYVSPHQALYDELGAKTTSEKISALAKFEHANGLRKDLVGANNPMFGKPKDPAIKAKLSKANSGEGNPYYGKSHSEETRQKMKEAHALRAPVSCPHCGKTGHLNPMKRWHFENCRSKT
jgi:group I intron endonuclease